MRKTPPRASATSTSALPTMQRWALRAHHHCPAVPGPCFHHALTCSCPQLVSLALLPRSTMRELKAGKLPERETLDRLQWCNAHNQRFHLGAAAQGGSQRPVHAMVGSRQASHQRERAAGPQKAEREALGGGAPKQKKSTGASASDWMVPLAQSKRVYPDPRKDPPFPVRCLTAKAPVPVALPFAGGAIIPHSAMLLPLCECLTIWHSAEITAAEVQAVAGRRCSESQEVQPARLE